MSEPAPPAAPPTGHRPAGTIRIGSLAGADVLVSSTWFVVAALIAVLVAPRIEQAQPGIGAFAYVGGVAFAVILYLSVLLHEASHAYVARHYGYGVTSITLHFLGGMTAIDSEARRPRQEFWIAVVGPLTSLAVGLAALGLWFVTPDGVLRVAVEGLAGANLIVGILNLVPGLPLDGGRVLKAAVWGATGDRARGVVVAAWGGRLVAVAVLAWPFLQERAIGVEAEIIDYLLAGLVALFLWGGASAALSAVRFRRRLPVVGARALARRPLAVPSEMPLAEAVRRAQESDAGAIVTVTSSGEPVGVVDQAAVLATPEDRRAWVPTSSVARELEDGLALPADIAGEDLLRAMTRTPASEYVLLEGDGSIFGVLTTSDVDRAYREATA